jgi:hypothetical protein
MGDIRLAGGVDHWVIYLVDRKEEGLVGGFVKEEGVFLGEGVDQGEEGSCVGFGVFFCNFSYCK